MKQWVGRVQTRELRGGTGEESKLASQLVMLSHANDKRSSREFKTFKVGPNFVDFVPFLKREREERIARV